MRAAVQNGDARKVAWLMRQDPGFNLNGHDEHGCTLLYYACYKSERSAVIPLLLAHPDIDVNVKITSGRTPYSIACFYGHTSCLREMLKDSRVKVNEPDDDGLTPLWRVASKGHLDVIKWRIASGREMDLGKPGDFKTDAIGSAKRYGNTEAATLLERFKGDAAKTRSELVKELGIDGQFPCSSITNLGLTFRLIVRFPCDLTA